MTKIDEKFSRFIVAEIGFFHRFMNSMAYKSTLIADDIW